MRLIQFFKEQIEKIRGFFKRKSASPPSMSNQRISIRSVNQRPVLTPTAEQNISVSVGDGNDSDTPRITIRGVNQRTPIASGGNVYSNEVDVQNANLGRGITVMRQRKPGRCPLCATRGGITESADGGNRWLCPACGSTFN